MILFFSDKGLNDFVKSIIWKYGEKKNNPNPTIPTVTYEIPLENGDIGAALHNVKLAANDLALIDSKMGMLDEVGVEITYTKKY